VVHHYIETEDIKLSVYLHSMSAYDLFHIAFGGPFNCITV